MSSLKHHIKGSPFPPTKDGKLRIYSMQFCPFAQRTRLLLHHKKIPFETINVSTKDKPDWFLERNPLGLVPVLEKDGKVVYESAICNEYLDEVYPECPMIPRDPYLKARERILQERFSKVVTQHYAILKSKGENKEAFASFQDHLDIFETELEIRGRYFGGDNVSNMDFFLWPFFERQCMFEKWGIKIDSNRFKHIIAWIARMYKIPAVKEIMIDREAYETFFSVYASGGIPDFDYGL